MNSSQWYDSLIPCYLVSRLPTQVHYTAYSVPVRLRQVYVPSCPTTNCLSRTDGRRSRRLGTSPTAPA
ncbi:hypothetical protein HRTV-11_gp108 [Halorubrum virus HRTV-11]|nr:hypothetical protein HRTV-11_gp108 [Halorubrum virus HRTV-11]